MSSENSLFCPSLKPTLQAKSLCSSIPCSSDRKITGLSAVIITASISAGSKISASSVRSNLAPKAKKNKIKKKSLNGFKLIAIYCEIGLVASVMPAIKAPISADRPTAWAASAIPKHQPMANRKIYSWKRSKRWIKRSNTYFTIINAAAASRGRLIKAKPIWLTLNCPDSLLNKTIKTKIASKSWISNKPIINSPVCLWCSMVVGKSLMLIMVLENIIAAPTTTASIVLKPNKDAMPKPTRANKLELASATNVAFLATATKACGCISRPSKNSKKIMPIWPLSSSSSISVTNAKP